MSVDKVIAIKPQVARAELVGYHRDDAYIVFVKLFIYSFTHIYLFILGYISTCK